MKKLLLLLVVAFMSVGAVSQNTLDILSKTGAVVSLALAEKPVITYSDSVLVLTTGRTSVEYPLSDLEKITFSGVESDVEVISAVGVGTEGNIYIFNTLGQEVMQIEAEMETDIPEIELEKLKAGTYIVKQGNITYKILRE